MKRHLLCLIFILASLVPARAEDPGGTPEEILYEGNSLYQYILVVEKPEKKERYIYNTKRAYTQGGISTEDPERLIFEYYRMSFISLAFLEGSPRDVLFVGLGAGAMPRYFSRRYPEARVDVVEIDPDMVSVAKRFFRFQETGNMKVHVSDGRMFIKRTPKKYDLIMLDAYQNDYIPFHLTTVEFLREVKKRLKHNGVVASNITSPFRNKFFYSMIETYKKEFEHLYIFRGEESDNYIFVATENEKGERDISRRAEKIQTERGFSFNLHRVGWALYGYYTEYQGEGKVLTDDFAPVNLYKHMKAE